jgi:hypothetical protein
MATISACATLEAAVITFNITNTDYLQHLDVLGVPET